VCVAEGLSCCPSLLAAGGARGLAACPSCGTVASPHPVESRLRLGRGPLEDAPEATQRDWTRNLTTDWGWPLDGRERAGTDRSNRRAEWNFAKQISTSVLALLTSLLLLDIGCGVTEWTSTIDWS
jgi:hypothetical protein